MAFFITLTSSELASALMVKPQYFFVFFMALIFEFLELSLSSHCSLYTIPCSLNKAS